MISHLVALALAVTAPSAGGQPASAPRPEPRCPQGSKLHISQGCDGNGAEQLGLECRARDADGLPIKEGPSWTYVVVRGGGGASYRRLEMYEYHAGKLDGLHRRWSADGDLVLEETLRDGKPAGVSRWWFSGGGLAAARHYTGGTLDGGSRAWFRGGKVRWSAVYDHGRLVSFEGDRTVAGEPCPKGAVPLASPDGLEEFCDRGLGRRPKKDGPYVVWGADGSIVERGLYRDGRKAQVWEAPPGAPPSPDQLAGILVAEGWMSVGDQDLGSVTNAKPNYWFRTFDGGEMIYPDATVNGAKIEVRGLPPGEYEFHTRIDANPANPEYYPGDLGGDARFGVKAGETTKFEVHLARILHLTAPLDNDQLLRTMELPCAEATAFPSPTRFAWEPPEPAVAGLTYAYRVKRVACEPYRVIGVLAKGTTRNTNIALELPPTHPGESYSFELTAVVGSKVVAFITTHGPRGTQGWDLPFRVGGR